MAVDDCQTQPRGGSGAMFDHVAPRYDLLNRLLSLGFDRRWRRAAVASLELEPGSRALDLATGTADVALEMVRQQPGVEVVGLDPSVGMIQVGRQKVARAGHRGRIALDTGAAEVLPFADRTFDAVAISFGIRNVEDRPQALREMARVTKPGGRIAILELSEPSGIMALGARLHMRVISPLLGGLLSNGFAYRYLPASIQAFPAPAEFARIMEANGHRVLEVRRFTAGVCTLFVSEPVAAAAAESAAVALGGVA